MGIAPDLFPDNWTPQLPPLKPCQTCKERKPSVDFYDDEDRCKVCCVTRASKFNRLKRTGWTDEQYQIAFQLQEGLYAICSQPETLTFNEKVRQLQADHNHITGQQRGLLCSRCNFVLGKVQENPEILRAAARYLEFWNVVGMET